MDVGMRIGMDLDVTASYISGFLSPGPWGCGAGDLVRVALPPPPAVVGIALSSCEEIKAGFNEGIRRKAASRPPNIPIRLRTWIRLFGCSTARPLDC